MAVLSSEQIVQGLSQLSDWELKDGAIEKNIEFKDFNEALAFIVRLGLLAEQANHHPELHNVYNKVQIRLNTHSEGGVTQKDFDLAQKFDKL